jgi:acyl-CoA thioesterase YciA
MMTAENTGAREAVIRTIAMPSDTNSVADIVVVWLMSPIDFAVGNAAAPQCIAWLLGQ